MAHSVIIWDLENSSMGGGTWNDEIICALRKDGTFRSRPAREGDDLAPVHGQARPELDHPRCSFRL